MDTLHDVHMLKITGRRSILRPVTWDPGRSGERSKNPENLVKLRCGCGGTRMRVVPLKRPKLSISSELQQMWGGLQKFQLIRFDKGHARERTPSC